MVIMRKVRANLPEQISARLWLFMFVDDVAASIEVANIGVFIPEVERISLEFKFQLVREKCAVHVPAWTEQPDAQRAEMNVARISLFNMMVLY